MKVLKSAARVVLASELDSLHLEVSRVKAELKMRERQCREYFDLIEGILAERDEWKAMFVTQSAQHEAAQAMLVKAIGRVRTQANVVLTHLNAYRRAQNLPPVEDLTVLSEESAPATYSLAVAQLKTEKKEDVDGLTVRNDIMNR
jgi:hypothetical protein